MTARSAKAFIRRRGIVLESAHGELPSLAETIAGGLIAGSWWRHSKGREIFALTRAVRDSKDILVCRLAGGKITYIHRRLWPALVRLAPRFDRHGLAAIREVHTKTGRHELRSVPFPRWVPPEVNRKAGRLSEASASVKLGMWYERLRRKKVPTGKSS